MLNPYSIILGLFVVTGLGVTLWGWHIIRQANQTQCWPSASGTITQSVANQNTLLPHIEFSYTIAGQTYQQTLQFPADVSPTQQFMTDYLNKYPNGMQVAVFYNPVQPDQAILEPGLAKGDKMVFALGLGMLIIGILLLLFS